MKKLYYICFTTIFCSVFQSINGMRRAFSHQPSFWESRFMSEIARQKIRENNAKIFAEKGVTYSNKLWCGIKKSVELQLDHSEVRFLEIKDLDPEEYKKWMLSKTAEDWYTESEESLVIEIKRASWLKGLGGFATDFIPRGVDVTHYTGVVHNESQFVSPVSHTLSYNTSYDMEFPVELSTKLFSTNTKITPLKFGNASRFLNHSSWRSNLEVVDKIQKDGLPCMVFRATKDIYPGQELTFNYGLSNYCPNVIRILFGTVFTVLLVGSDPVFYN